MQSKHNIGIQPLGIFIAGFAPILQTAGDSWLRAYIALILLVGALFWQQGKVKLFWGLGLFYFAALVFLWPGTHSGLDGLWLAVLYAGLAIHCGIRYSKDGAGR